MTQTRAAMVLRSGQTLGLCFEGTSHRIADAQLGGRCPRQPECLRVCVTVTSFL